MNSLLIGITTKIMKLILLLLPFLFLSCDRLGLVSKDQEVLSNQALKCLSVAHENLTGFHCPWEKENSAIVIDAYEGNSQVRLIAQRQVAASTMCLEQSTIWISMCSMERRMS